jgi:hypothetical protein
MNDEVLLTLHCPKCKQLVDVVAEGDNLICLDCGWRFDDKTTAKLLSPTPPQDPPPAKP